MLLSILLWVIKFKIVAMIEKPKTNQIAIKETDLNYQEIKSSSSNQIIIGPWKIKTVIIWWEIIFLFENL